MKANQENDMTEEVQQSQRGPMMTAMHEVWRTAMTLANNICVQVSDRLNADDKDTEAAGECIDRIRPYVNVSDEMLAEMLAESGATEQIESAAKHIRMLEQRVTEAYSSGFHYGLHRAAACCREVSVADVDQESAAFAEGARRCSEVILGVSING